MRLSQCARLINDRVDGSSLTHGTYISTENMVSNLGGFVPSDQCPNFAVTAYRRNDILLSNIRPYFKKIVFAKTEGGSSNDVICIRADKTKVLPQFLYYCLCADAFFDYYVSNCKGTKMPRGDKQALLNYDVPDFSLEEQRHIVDAIGSIDDLIEKDSKIVSKALQAARLHYDAVVLSDPLATLVPFESLLENCTTGLNPRKNFRLGEGECFYVTIKNMDGNNIILDDRCDKITKEAVCKIQCRSKIKSGCTLFSGIGTIGRTFLCREQPINWNISESVFCFTPKKGIPPEFVYECVNSREFQDFANINASGAAQKGIRMADLKAHLVPLVDGSAMKEYENTAKVFLSVVGSKQREISALKRAKAILLDRYFTNR